MALKSYSFTRTNEKGDNENCYITFDSEHFSWKPAEFSVVFQNFSGIDESDRKILRIGKPEPQAIETRPPFVLKLSGNNFLTLAMTPITEAEAGLPFLLFFSNKIWQMAHDNPFIPDFSTIDAEDNRVEVLKSLTDLNAVLHEIEF